MTASSGRGLPLLKAPAVRLAPEEGISSRRTYFCTEPWIGIFSVETNRDVTFCPCYLKMKIGNLDESSMKEIWNSEALIQLRISFAGGVLPDVCRPQLCPVALGKDR